MGRRINEPAKDNWFVPGGRIFKNEDLKDAFRRICQEELGIELAITKAQLFGAFTHNKEVNVFGKPGISTHYVVLAYDLNIVDQPLDINAQHSAIRWISESEANCPGSDIHHNVLPYYTVI